jgi:hypothetical protein
MYSLKKNVLLFKITTILSAYFALTNWNHVFRYSGHSLIFCSIHIQSLQAWKGKQKQKQKDQLNKKKKYTTKSTKFSTLINKIEGQTIFYFEAVRLFAHELIKTF